MSQQPTVYLETFGCQMNALDSELVFGTLMQRGYRPTEDFTTASLVVINTCSVRQHAEDKVYSRLGQLKGSRVKNPDRIVAVIGCMAERDGDGLLDKAPIVDILCGPGDLHRLPALIDDVRENNGRAIALSGKLRERTTEIRAVAPHDDLEALDSGRAFASAVHAHMPRAIGRHQAYVRITRGCNKHCTFCVVPYTRGPEQHRPPDQIVDEVRRLADAGVMEVTLLGQTVNHYHYCDGGEETSFARLLRRVHDEVPQLPRLRFVTSFPRDFTDEALEVMAASPRICRYLHIPAQSGSNSQLKKMNRGYTVESYLALLDRARKLMPDIAIAGDMIVGFCGETDADFQASCDLLRAARYKNCFIFKYSSRPGTPADERFTDDVPDEVKRRRNNELLAVQAEVNMANHRDMIGRTVEVLVEGPSKSAIKAQESEQDRGSEIDHARDDALRSEPSCPQPGEGARNVKKTRLRNQLVGRTSGDQIVVFDGAPTMIGSILPVEITAVTPYTLHGSLAGDVSSRHEHSPSRVELSATRLSLPILSR